MSYSPETYRIRISPLNNYCARVLGQPRVLWHMTGISLDPFSKISNHWNGVCAPTKDVEIYDNNDIFARGLHCGHVDTNASPQSPSDIDFALK